MIKAIQSENKLTLKIHSGIESYSWYEDGNAENNVANVSDLETILEANKNASLIDVYINSAGGDVFEGIGIYNILKRNKAYVRVYVDGFACSIASVIAMAGNAIYMPKSSMMMIHNCWTWACGNANDLRKLADDMDKMNNLSVTAYMNRFTGTEEKLRELLDNETYLSADECLEYGLCTKVIEDGEETEAMVDSAIDYQTNLYSAKLEQLRSIKEAFNAENSVEAEPVNEATVETAEEEEFNEATNESHTKEEVIEAVASVKQNALHAFFNIKKGN